MARPVEQQARRGETKRKPREERRAELLDTAIEVFREKGYEAASLHDIADRLGILKGSLYYYIQSKEELLYEVISATHQQGMEVIIKAAQTDGDALSRLSAVIEAHVLHTCRNLAKVTVFLHELNSLPPESRERIVGREHAYQAVFRRLIISGQHEGVIRADVDPKVAALSILGSINWVYRWFQPGGSLSPAKVARQLAEMNICAVGEPEALRSRAGAGPSQAAVAP